jgi:hypothetical protein
MAASEKAASEKVRRAAVFRRRRRERADQLGSKADGAPEEHDSAEQELVLDDQEDAPADGSELLTIEEAVLADPDGGLSGPQDVIAAQEAVATGSNAAGPWDAQEKFPPDERIDFGSLQVPVREGFEIQLNLAEDQGPLITVLRGDSSLQLQAFAAAKSGGLWDDVRREIAAAVAEAGGSSDEAGGRFGVELRARVKATEAGPESQAGGLQPIRFLGVDGPRWFLRGVITGPAAHHRSAADPLEDIFGGIVVVRGEHPAPPRDLLEIQLPEQARQAMEEQMAEAEGGPSVPNPFERGPEITETR